MSVLWDSKAWSWRPECSACLPSIRSAKRAMAAAFSATWRLSGTWWWWCGAGAAVAAGAAGADGAVDGASDAVLIDRLRVERRRRLEPRELRLEAGAARLERRVVARGGLEGRDLRLLVREARP